MDPAVLLRAVLAAILAASCVFLAGRALQPVSARARRVKEVLTPGGGRSAPARLQPVQPAVPFKLRAASAIARALDLKRWLGLEEVKEQLQQAGMRQSHAETAFLVSRLVWGIGGVVLAVVYVFGLKVLDVALPAKLGVVAFGGYIGLKIPEILLDRAIKARRESIERAWPDALDLMLIMVQAGVTVEQAFRKVQAEIGSRSQPLAEELMIAIAELSFLPERRQAYENLGKRTGVSEVRATCMALIQAETQGTPLADAFRTLAAEGRASRLTAAEQKGARMAAIMPLPVMLFFLPPLLAMAIMPAIIDLAGWK